MPKIQISSQYRYMENSPTIQQSEILPDMFWSSQSYLAPVAVKVPDQFCLRENYRLKPYLSTKNCGLRSDNGPLSLANSSSGP